METAAGLVKEIHMQRAIGLAAIAAMLFVGVVRAQTVTLKSLTETRELAVVKSTFSGWHNGIELSLHIDGPAVAGATKYGKVKILKAVDDVGTDLSKAGEGPSSSNDQF